MSSNNNLYTKLLWYKLTKIINTWTWWITNNKTSC